MGLTFAAGAYAQDVVAAKAGLVHYVEGDVTIGGKTVVVKGGDFPEMQKGDELRTVLGRAEVLLGPGMFLRMAENSGFRLLSAAIEDTRLEVTSGSVLIEAAEFEAKHHGIVVRVGSTDIDVMKRGLYRIDFSPAMLRVYEGSAQVIAGGQPVTIKEGRQTVLGALANPEKFNKDRGDAFHRWAARRSSYIAIANVAAAKRIYDDGGAWRSGNWLFNPYFGCFTYIPYSGMYRSPFGWAFYSPRAVQRVYYRPPVVYNPSPGMSGGGFDGGFGHRGYSDYGGRSSMGSHSAGGTAAPPPPAAAPAPAASGRADAGGGGGRSSAGGR
jgi:hypothetical protein